MVVSFLYSGVICVSDFVVHTRGCMGYCSMCLVTLWSVDYVIKCAGCCRMYLFATLGCLGVKCLQNTVVT